MRLWCLLAFGLVAAGCASRHTQSPPLPPFKFHKRVKAPVGSIVFADVSVIPMDRQQEVLTRQTVVVSGGRIVAIEPWPEIDVPDSATQIDGRGKFLLPGLADMHVHALDDEDLFLYLAAGVTQVRATYAQPHVMAQRDRVARGEVIGPSVHVEGQITDGSPPVWDWSFAVASEADVDRVIAFHIDNHLPAIKVYERLSLPMYDLLVAKAREAGLRIIGHVPEQVGLAYALASKQSSIEHLDGYNVYLADKDSYAAKRRYWQSSPIDWAGFVASFQFVDEKRLADVAMMTRRALTWNCPTLVLYDHTMRSDDPAERIAFRGARYLSPFKKSHWAPGSFPLVRTPGAYDFQQMRLARPRLLALVRALDAADAGLLVGTDSGNAGIVPGYSTLDELELFVEAGVSPWRALRAATSGAAQFLGQEEEWGSIAVGRRADFLLLRASPLEDVKNLAFRDGVMARGRWFPAAELEAELAKRVEYNTGKRSRLAETPPPPVEGTRELAARYLMRHGDEYGGEQRLVIDRLADGERVITAEILAAPVPERVRVEVGDGHGNLVRRESSRGVVELRRAGARLHATYNPAGGGKPVSATFDLPRTTYLSAVSLAPDQLLYAAAMKLRPGGQVTLQVVQVYSGTTLSLARSIFRLLRTPDRKDRPGVRIFSLSITASNQTFKGELLLDREGRLVEQTMLGETTVRADPASGASE